MSAAMTLSANSSCILCWNFVRAGIRWQGHKSGGTRAPEGLLANARFADPFGVGACGVCQCLSHDRRPELHCMGLAAASLQTARHPAVHTAVYRALEQEQDFLVWQAVSCENIQLRTLCAFCHEHL